MADRASTISSDHSPHRPEADPPVAMPEEELLFRLERSREHAAQGRWKPAEAVISVMKEKHGL